MKSGIRHGDNDQPSYPAWNSLSKSALTVLLASSFMGCSQQEKSLGLPGVPPLSPGQSDGNSVDSEGIPRHPPIRLMGKVRSDPLQPDCKDQQSSSN